MTSEKLDIAIQRGITWLLNSGIQDLEPDSRNYGSTAAWFDNTSGQYSFLYSEIAGYAITSHCYFHSMNGDEEHLKRARATFDWLENRAFKNVGYRCRQNPGEEDFISHVCSFDNAMVLNGLANLYSTTKEDHYLEAARRTADWLLGMQNEDGSFNAKFDLASNSILNSPERWSTQPGVLHIKHAVGLANFFKVTGDKKYLDAVEKVCDWGLNFFEGNSRFITNTAKGDTYIHPHCYAIEGYLAAVKILKLDRYLPDAKIAGSWLLNGLTDDGGISQHFDGRQFSVDEHVDSMAQSARIWMLLSQYSDFDINRGILESVIDRILAFQCSSDDPQADGGFYYGTVDGQLRKHVSNHGTLFAVQTLMMYRDFTEGNLDFDMNFYV